MNSGMHVYRTQVRVTTNLHAHANSNAHAHTCTHVQTHLVYTHPSQQIVMLIFIII